VAVITVHPEVVPVLAAAGTMTAIPAWPSSNDQRPPRRMLLSELEHAYPGGSPACSCACRPSSITPLDRRHLFGTYPEARSCIASSMPSARPPGSHIGSLNAVSA
jgi:hypothetical protein